jgi:hypothetical protein
MHKRGQKRRGRSSSFLPRNSRERRQVELLGGVTFILLSGIIVAAFLLTGFHQFELRSSNVAAVVSAVLVDLANGDRSQNGLGNLTVSPLLVEAAQAKANDMAEKSYFAHTSPQGIDPWFWFSQVGYKFYYAGENLAVNFSDSGDVNIAWMNSPEHRANILDPHFTEIGIATAQGVYEGQTVTFVVQEFGTPAPQRATQKPVAVQNIPSTPTQPAIASATGSQSVLGTTVTEKPSTPPPAPKPVVVKTQQVATTPPQQIATTAPAVAASLAKNVNGNIPWWGYVIAFPRDALQDTYFFFGAIILVALAYETGFEVHTRHAKKAVAVGGLFVAMLGFFVLANLLFFAHPVLALTAASL